MPGVLVSPSAEAGGWKREAIRNSPGGPGAVPGTPEGEGPGPEENTPGKHAPPREGAARKIRPEKHAPGKSALKVRPGYTPGRRGIGAAESGIAENFVYLSDGVSRQRHKVRRGGSAKRGRKCSNASWASARSATCSAITPSATSTARVSTASPRSPMRRDFPTCSSAPASRASATPERDANAASRPACRTRRARPNWCGSRESSGSRSGSRSDASTSSSDGRRSTAGELSMAHPELETVEQALSHKAESGMQGIYPSTEKLSNVLGAKGMYQIVCNL